MAGSFRGSLREGPASCTKSPCEPPQEADAIPLLDRASLIGRVGICRSFIVEVEVVDEA